MSKFISENHQSQKGGGRGAGDGGGRQQVARDGGRRKEGGSDPLRSPDKTLFGQQTGNWRVPPSGRRMGQNER
jgi:hypothetical protein